MISLTNVTKRFGGCTAVDGVCLSVEPGESVALLGPNGAGKTTIVRMLMGFSTPSSGTITVDGKPPGDPRARRHVGFLAENHCIPPFLTGRQYLLRHAGLLGLSRDTAFPMIDGLVERVGMRGKENARARTYSRGMLQRMGLAAAMLGTPRLLVLDEPVSGLDPLGMRDVRAMLEQCKQEGITILLNSHLLSEVEKTCTAAAIIDRGRILVTGTIADIAGTGETLEEVFIRYVKGNDEAAHHRR